jgi:hypothetical protein
MFDLSSSLTTEDLGFGIAAICPPLPYRLPDADPSSCIKSITNIQIDHDVARIVAGRDFYIRTDRKYIYAVARRLAQDDHDDITAQYFCMAAFPRDENLVAQLKKMSKNLTEGGPANELKGSIGSIAATLVSPSRYKLGWARCNDSEPFCDIARNIVDQSSIQKMLRIEFIQSHMKTVECEDRKLISKNMGWRPRSIAVLIEHAARNNFSIGVPHHKIKLFDADQKPTHLHRIMTEICSKYGYLRFDAKKQSFFIKPKRMD